MDTQTLINDLNWRYATKVFSDKKISDADLRTLCESMRLAPSSFGLQPWRFVIVKNNATREKLVGHARNQAQVKDASHLIVLCHHTSMTTDRVDEYVDDMVATTGADRESLSGYIDMMKGFVASKSDAELNVWMTKQVYIALGFLMQTAAHMHIDTCPMEGFDPVAFDEILGLKDLGLTSCVICPVGYRSDEDKYAERDKVRFDYDKVVIEM